MRAALLLGVILCTASTTHAADDSLLEAADNYYQCAAFYQGAQDAKLLPKGRIGSKVEADIAKAILASVGLGITAREGQRRMTFAEIEAMERKVAKKAHGFEKQFREDPSYAKGWIADGFEHCDEKMGLLGATL